METNASPGRRACLHLCTLIRGWPWYFESTPIFPHEVLLRTIPNVRGYFNALRGKWAVDPYAFEPHKKRDTDGMSFFRADFTTSKKLVHANRHPKGVRIALITILRLRELGLDVECAPDPSQPAGHVIVPGMRFVPNRSNEEKRRVIDLSQKLAQHATENGVYCPPGLPDPD